jgi:glycosyltransferase involved in cell wall biosynthesis
MELKNRPLRIGVVDLSSGGWAAGRIYSKMTLRALESHGDLSGAQVCFISANELNNNSTGTEWIRLDPPQTARIKGEARWRHLLHLTDGSDPFAVAQARAIDVLLPLLDVPPWTVRSKLIGWIPDFQHIFLPELFTERELASRDATFRRLASQATFIVLSSNAALEDFKAFAPGAAPKARVLSFPSLLAYESLTDDPTSSVTRFNLPQKFAMVVNQFWAHKNHKAVVSALGQLCRGGTRIPTVMTGLPSDHRDPSNANFSSLLQQIAREGLNSEVTILGHVPYTDLINLIRSAAVIVQPSRFEGWSTIVEDAKALGRPLICSDIAVHREQAPDALGFFPCDEPAVLADLLALHWPKLAAGPDTQLENSALMGAREYARQHADKLLRLCKQAGQHQ